MAVAVSRTLLVCVTIMAGNYLVVNNFQIMLSKSKQCCFSNILSFWYSKSRAVNTLMKMKASTLSGGAMAPPAAWVLAAASSWDTARLLDSILGNSNRTKAGRSMMKCRLSWIEICTAAHQQYEVSLS